MKCDFCDKYYIPIADNHWVWTKEDNKWKCPHCNSSNDDSTQSIIEDKIDNDYHRDAARKNKIGYFDFLITGCVESFADIGRMMMNNVETKTIDSGDYTKIILRIAMINEYLKNLIGIGLEIKEKKCYKEND